MSFSIARADIAFGSRCAQSIRWLRILLSAALPAALPVAFYGCSAGGNVAPILVAPSLAGRLDLVEYDGAALPATLRVIAAVSAIPGDTRTSTCPELLNGSTIQIASDGGVTRTSRLSYPCTGALPRPASLPDSTTQVEAGRETATGDSLTFSYSGTATGQVRTEYARTAGSDLVFYLAKQGTGVQGSVSLIHRVYRRH